MKFTKPYQSVSPVGSVSVVDAKNVYYEIDGNGGFVIRRRPGMSAAVGNSGTPNGLHWHNSNLYSISNDTLYKHATATSKAEIGTVNGSGRAEFSNGQEIDTTPFFYMARNAAVQYYDSAITTPADAPTATSISLLGSRFWANSGEQDFYITGVNPASGLIDPFYWLDASNPWRAIQNADRLVKIFSAWGESYLFGEEICEVWQEDGIYPISPLIGSTIEMGLLAKDSVVKGDNTIFCLALVGGKRCVVKLQDRFPVVISEPISDILSSLATVSDAIGSTCFAGGVNLYILKFPTVGRTFCYDFKNDMWTEWAGFTSGQWTDCTAHGMIYAPGWNQTIAQTTGGLSEVSREVFTDNGQILRASIVTGNIDHNTYSRKRCNSLTLKCKAYSGTPASLIFRYRDNGRPEWSNYIEVPLSAQSQQEYYTKIHNLGIYRSRQYEFVMTDAVDLALIGFDEDVRRVK